MKLLIALASYRVPDLTIDCLRSLSKEIHRVPGTKVGICENGTGGDAAERIRRAIEENGWGSWAYLFEVYPNRGFTGGTNAVIRPALASDDPPDYVLLLNCDTIVQEHALDTLVAFMDGHPKAGMAASTFFSPEGEILPTVFRFPGILSELDRGLRLGIVSKWLLSRWVTVPPPPNEACKADWLCAASLILRRTMLEQIGLLDEDMFSYCDDVDLGMRAQEAGWEAWYVPESRVIHLEGQSTGIASHQQQPDRRPSYWFQARRRLFLKHYGAFYTAVADAVFIAAFATWRVRRRLQRKPDTDPPKMLIDSIRHSIFCTGPKLRVVENPAMAMTQPPMPPKIPDSLPASTPAD